MLKKITIFFLAIAISVTISLSYLLCSESGLNILVSHLNKNYGEEFYIKGPSGSIASNISVEDILYKNENVVIHSVNNKFKISLWSLLFGKIYIEQFDADNITLNPSKSIIGKIYGINENNLSLNLKKISASLSLSKEKLTAKLKSVGKITKDDTARLYMDIDGKLSSLKIKGVLEIDDNINKFEGMIKSSSLTLKTFPSSDLHANINFDWSQQLKWDVKFYGQIKLKNKDIDAINLDIASHTLKNNITLDIKELTLPVADKTLNIQSKFDISENEIRGKSDLSFGQNNASLIMDITNKISLTGKFDISNLDDILPGIAGDGAIEISVSENISAPKFNLFLDMKNVNYNDIFLSQAKGNFVWQGDKILQAVIELKDISNDFTFIENIKGNVEGNISDHKANIAINNSDTQITSKISGSLSESSQWQGEVTDLIYNHKNFTTKINEPFKIKANDSSFSFNEMCLLQEENKLCADCRYNISKGDWDLKLKSNNFNIIELGELNIGNIASIKSGILNGSLDIGGSKNSINKKKGVIKISDLAIHFNTNNINQKLNFLNLDLNNNKLKINAEYNDKDKQLKIAGDYKGNIGKIDIYGKNIDVINTAELQATVDANIRAETKNNIVTISGDAKVTKGNIKSSFSPYVVDLPSDISIKNIDNKPGYSVLLTLSPNSKLHIDVTDNVKIDIMNTTGNIAGKLDLIYLHEITDFAASGELKIENAKYKKYGKELFIKKGLLTYNEDSIYNPNLDIIAIRDITNFENDDASLENDKIEAGIMISGSSSSPKVRLFSVPEGYTDEEILSLIVFGKVYSFDSDNNYAMNKDSVVISSQVLNSSGILNNIGHSMNIDQVSILDEGSTTSDSNTSDTVRSGLKIALSKKISDKVTLTMIYGLYTESYKFSAQYMIYDNVALKVYTSENSDGLSLIYNFN